MNDELQKNIRYSRQRFFHSLLRGRLGWQERESTAAVIGFDLKADWYCAGILGTETPGNEVHASDILQLLEKIQQEHFASDCRLHSVWDEQERILLFFSGKGQTRRELAERIADDMEHIREVLRGQEGVPVRCALGRLCQSYEALERSYREASDLWRVSLVKEKSVHTYPEESGSVFNADVKSEALIDKLLLDLQMGEKMDALTDLDALMACYGSCSPSMAEKISMRLFKLVLQISELMREVDEQEVAWSEQNLIGYLRQHFSTASLWEVRGMLGSYIERCCEYFARCFKKYYHCTPTEYRVRTVAF